MSVEITEDYCSPNCTQQWRRVDLNMSIVMIEYVYKVGVGNTIVRFGAQEFSGVENWHLASTPLSGKERALKVELRVSPRKINMPMAA